MRKLTKAERARLRFLALIPRSKLELQQVLLSIDRLLQATEEYATPDERRLIDTIRSVYRTLDELQTRKRPQHP